VIGLVVLWTFCEVAESERVSSLSKGGIGGLLREPGKVGLGQVRAGSLSRWRWGGDERKGKEQMRHKEAAEASLWSLYRRVAHAYSPSSIGCCAFLLLSFLSAR